MANGVDSSALDFLLCEAGREAGAIPAERNPPNDANRSLRPQRGGGRGRGRLFWRKIPWDELPISRYGCREAHHFGG